MTTTNWLDSKNPNNEIPGKIRNWADGQPVRFLAANEGMEKWGRYDGQTRVVRR